MIDSIAIGSDHAGFDLKEALKKTLTQFTENIYDFGPDTGDSVDYPDFAHPVAEAVEKGTHPLGVLICGSANGVAMTANKHNGIRAAICWTTELAELARTHNNSNILCLPARFISIEDAESIVKAYFSSSFEGGRHERRVNKISC